MICFVHERADSDYLVARGLSLTALRPGQSKTDRLADRPRRLMCAGC